MRRQTERWLRWAPPLAVGVALALVVAYGVVGPRQSASPSGWAEVFEAVSPSVLLVSIEAPESRVGTAFAVSATEAVTVLAAMEPETAAQTVEVPNLKDSMTSCILIC